jgi:hypothetical protein
MIHGGGDGGGGDWGVQVVGTQEVQQQFAAAAAGNS